MVEIFMFSSKRGQAILRLVAAHRCYANLLRLRCQAQLHHLRCANTLPQVRVPALSIDKHYKSFGTFGMKPPPVSNPYAIHSMIRP